jgi:EAL domain-containing protein (putative c-di-GMP-specific phosphodiesterase class I)/FixJ family two-component response regulator
LSTPPITTVIADDEPLVRELLLELLAVDGRIKVVGVARNGDEALAIVARIQPDVALVDVKMPGGGPGLVRAVAGCSPATRVVALSGSEDDAVALEMLDAGAASYVVKRTAAGQLVDTVLRSARGERVLAPEVSGGVIDALSERRGRAEEGRRRDADAVQRVLREHLFEPVFQPIVELTGGTTVGHEALSRFSAEPTMTPDRWFARAERAGLRTELELAALRAAVDRFQASGAQGFVSLNLSPQTLDGAEDVLPAGMDTVVEITEHAAIDDYQPVLDRIERLRTRGVRVAVDDAGAGFASLRHTLLLMPDLIKLDVSLTRGLDNDNKRRALAAGMVGFARELGAGIVAEGVETPAEVEALRVLGVQFAQGYHFGRPGPLR